MRGAHHDTNIRLMLMCMLCLKYASPEQQEEGRKRYEAQKMERLETKARIEEVVPPPSNPGNNPSPKASNQIPSCR